MSSLLMPWTPRIRSPFSNSDLILKKKNRFGLLLLLCLIASHLPCSSSSAPSDFAPSPSDNAPSTGSSSVDPPTLCETCYHLAMIIQKRADRVYKKTESEFIELSESVCGEMTSFKLHKDKVGVARFSTDESSLMKTVKEMRDRGVEVNLGIPEEMWDKPAAEVSMMKMECERMMGEREEELEKWFMEGAEEAVDFLCRRLILAGSDTSCLLSSARNEL